MEGSAFVDGTCLDELTVEIKNQYTGIQDLSNTTQNALLGAQTILRSQVSSNSPATKTYKWKLNGIQQETTAHYATYFDRIGENTVTLEVTQGQTVVTKSFTINASLPKLVENVPDIPSTTDGFYGTERPPFITSLTTPCGRDGSTRYLILGCLTEFPITRRKIEDINIAGLYAKATVAPPDNFISDGEDSYVEVQQIIKPTVARYGVDENGISFSECIGFADASANGWRSDIRGGLNPNSPPGYKIATTFRNNQSGANGREVLDFIDGPGIIIEESGINGGSIKNYLLINEFKTYITYFANSFEGQGVIFGTDERHAIAELPWRWRAQIKKSGSSWQFVKKSPTTITNLESTKIPYAPNSTGEISYSGSLEGNFYEPCNNLQPITTTTKSNVAVWRKTDGIWYVINPDGSMQTSAAWGVENDIPVPGDYDGDGLADFAVFRPDNPATPEDECLNGCSWYIIRSSDGGIQQRSFGINGDKPVPADYNGDGKADLAVFRPSANDWYILNDDGSYNQVNFGAASDIPVPSDYDGDGIDDIATWRSSDATWYVLKSGDQTYAFQQWGTSTDKPVIGDYDGDGKTDFATWQTTGDWHILLSADGQTKTVNLGNPMTDIAVQGNYDGDDKTDVAIYQTGLWQILNSTTNQIQTYTWGIEGDIPIPAAYSR